LHSCTFEHQWFACLQAVNMAYKVLVDQSLRSRYDQGGLRALGASYDFLHSRLKAGVGHTVLRSSCNM